MSFSTIAVELELIMSKANKKKKINESNAPIFS